MDTNQVQAGLHILSDGTSHKLSYPEVIAWAGKEWVPVSDIAVWDNGEWRMIDLAEKTDELIQAAFAMSYSPSPILPIPPE